MSEFYLTTAILFEDGHMEGQVLHVGTKEDCERMADLIPAVAYSGEQKVREARLSVVPNTEAWGGPITAGERWHGDAEELAAARAQNEGTT